MFLLIQKIFLYSTKLDIKLNNIVSMKDQECIELSTERLWKYDSHLHIFCTCNSGYGMPN